MKNKKLSNILNKKNGNSLMEFAVTIGLMAILAATAAPKLSQMGENTRIAKSRTELDKLARQAANFYQETAIKEGRGRFPGQINITFQSVGIPITKMSWMILLTYTIMMAIL